MNVLDEVTAPQFLVSFLQLAAEKKTPKTVGLWRHLGRSFKEVALVADYSSQMQNV